MKSLVTRIDYEKQSFCIHLNNIVYLHFVDGSAAKLYVRLGFGHDITIEEGDPAKFSQLKQVYLDIYTKWKNANESMEDEIEVYEYE